MSNVQNIIQPYSIIDTGDTEELVGDYGWEILHVSDRTNKLCG